MIIKLIKLLKENSKKVRNFNANSTNRRRRWLANNLEKAVRRRITVI